MPANLDHRCRYVNRCRRGVFSELVGYSVAEMPDIVIREATPADCNRLANLRYEFRSQVDKPVEDQDTFIQRCSAWMYQRLAADWKAWVAVRSGEIAGQVWLQLVEKLPNCNGEPEVHGYITNLYVRPGCRGGVGSQLLAQALNWLQDKSVDAVILWPTPRSRTLYLRHGFREPRDILELRSKGASPGRG